MRAHRQIETRPRRQRLFEPALVDCNDLTAAGESTKRALDNFGELRIVLAEHERVIGIRQEVADHAEIASSLLVGQHSVELHVVVRESISLAACEYLDRLVV